MRPGEHKPLLVGVITDAGTMRNNSGSAAVADAEFQAKRKAHLERTRYRCAFCSLGMRSNEVHHRDGDHANNDESNFATACYLCHGYHHLGQRAVGMGMAGAGQGEPLGVALIPEISAIRATLHTFVAERPFEGGSRPVTSDDAALAHVRFAAGGLARAVAVVPGVVLIGVVEGHDAPLLPCTCLAGHAQRTAVRHDQRQMHDDPGVRVATMRKNARARAEDGEADFRGEARHPEQRQALQQRRGVRHRLGVPVQVAVLVHDGEIDRLATLGVAHAVELRGIDARRRLHRMRDPEAMGWKYSATWMRERRAEVDALLAHIRALWADNFLVGENALNRLVSETRAALEDSPRAPRVTESWSRAAARSESSTS